jgi:hypothetical protein
MVTLCVVHCVVVPNSLSLQFISLYSVCFTIFGHCQNPLFGNIPLLLFNDECCSIGRNSIAATSRSSAIGSTISHHSVLISDSYVDNTMTLYRLRRWNGRPPYYI